MQLFSKLTIAFFLIMLTGCHAFQNLSTDEVRQEKYFYKNVTFEKSIKEIQSALYTYTSNCRPMVPFNVNPKNPKKAQMLFKLTGLTKTSIIGVLDFKEIKQDSTLLTSYSYYSTWESEIDGVIDAIRSPKSCQ